MDDVINNEAVDVLPPPPPPALIRPFTNLADLKIVRYLIGAGMMEPSSSANQTALWTPFVVLIWAVTTHFLVLKAGGGWPKNLENLLSGRPLVWTNWSLEAVQILKVLPTLVAPPIILLALFEMRHRNQFEESMIRAIGEEDMIDIEGYYSTKSSSSSGEKSTKVEDGGRKGFFVLEYDNRIIGAFGIDGRKPGKVLETISDIVAAQEEEKKTDSPSTPTTTPSAPDSPYPLRNRSSKSLVPASSTTTPFSNTSSPSTYTDFVHLRRFSTSLSFRSAGIDDDLINYATAFAFSTSSPSSLPPAKKIIFTLRPKIEKTLLGRIKKAGFKEIEKGNELMYNPEGWRDGKKKGLGMKLVELFWPLDLGFKTYVLDRDVWAALAKGSK